MPTTNAKKIVISGEYERKLEKAAPSYLKGRRRTTQQIRWIIDEFLKLRREAEKAESN